MFVLFTPVIRIQLAVFINSLVFALILINVVRTLAAFTGELLLCPVCLTIFQSAQPPHD